jgi:5-methylcytosine-specific restriction endonuclease McrA
MSRNDYRAIRRAKAVQEFGGKCVRCESTDRLQFDHVNPATKKYRVRDLWHSRAKYLEEAPKLQLLCYGCHKAKTAIEQTKPLVHGTVNAYNRKGCRCDECRNVMKELRAYYRALLKQGKGRPVPNER